MKMTDMVISAIIKKGILYEARNCDLEFEIPMEDEEKQEHKMLIRFTADHMMLKIEKM